MDISPAEAEQSLKQVEETTQRAHRTWSYAGADSLLILWGLIWLLGYLASQFLPGLHARHWFALIGVGGVATFVVLTRHTAVRSAEDRRIFWFWILLFAYAGLWVALLWPFIRLSGHAEHDMFYKHFGAIWATVPMFAFVVMGLWFERFMAWLGLGITALTLLGLLAFPAFFWLWMGVSGGGALLATGLIVRGRWR